MSIKPINIAEVEVVACRLAQNYMSYDEPIPDFPTRFPNVLESCLIIPFQKYQKKPLYYGLYNKASILLYLLIKNHPFQNGNKRIAITSLLVFLDKNNKWIKVDNIELYNFAVWVARSPSELKDETISAIKKFLKNHVIDR